MLLPTEGRNLSEKAADFSQCFSISDEIDFELSAITIR